MRVLGIDIGTQSLKAVVCDERLVVLGAASVPCTTRYPAPGHAEQDPAQWEAALAPAIAGALGAARCAPTDIVALAIAGQLDGCIAVDEHGAALHPALIWQDRRAVADVDRVEARALFERTGQVADASHLAPKLRWLRQHLATRPARYHQPVSYLVERLTGAAVIDPALASTTMLLAVATGQWDPSLLAAFEIDASELPQVRAATAVAGTLDARGAALTGLPAGIRVAVGTGDDFATPLGAGVVAPGPAICAIGTAEVVGALSATAVLDTIEREPMVETHLYPTGGYFVENPGWLAGGAVRWVSRLLSVTSDAELDALAAMSSPGAQGLVFVPALAGAMTPVWRPHARGTFHGLTVSHDRADLARAVLEGLAFATRDVLERLRAMALPVDRVLLLGGGSRSTVWAQIRADVLGVAHGVAADPDTCPVGAAMIAAVAAGWYPDLRAAAACAPAPAREVMPGEANLDEAYARYRRVVDTLGPLAASPWAG